MINNIIAVLGWEERFVKGVKKNLDKFNSSTLHLIIFEEYESYSRENLKEIETICTEKEVNVEKSVLSYQKPADSWRQLEHLVVNKLEDIDKVILDISTMPRETIWALLFFLQKTAKQAHFIYYKPSSYGEWLCKEPDRPRLLYKHSGIAEFGRRTALMILTGYDYDRTNQLVRFYEPALTILGLQKGNQFDNKSRNIEELHRNECNGGEVKSFEIDFYDGDFGLSVLNEKIIRLKGDYNIIVASLGPKISSIAIYRLFLKHPEIALTYVPTKEYNKVYSVGILDEPIYGKF